MPCPPLPDTGGGAPDYLYNPPVTGAPAAPVSDAGVAPSGPTGSYPYLYNPPVTGPTGQPLDYTGLPDAINNATVTPVSLFGGDSGNTQASNFVPNPSGGYWGYDENWNWVGDVAAPTEPAMTTAANENLFTDEGDMSGSGPSNQVATGGGEVPTGEGGGGGTAPPAPGQGYDPNAPGGDYFNAETGGDMNRLQNEGAFGMGGPNVNTNIGGLGSYGDAGGGFFASTMNFNPGGGDLSSTGGQVISSSVGPPQGGGGPPMWGPMDLSMFTSHVAGLQRPYSPEEWGNMNATEGWRGGGGGQMVPYLEYLKSWHGQSGISGLQYVAASQSGEQGGMHPNLYRSVPTAWFAGLSPFTPPAGPSQPAPPGGGITRGDLSGASVKASRHTPTVVPR
jgi:hypothetical protein